MRRLLGLGQRWDDCHLPLTEAAAGQLAETLLEDNPDDRITPLTDLLSVEPPLALWTVCRAKSWSVHPPDGLADLATWLAEQGLYPTFWGHGVAEHSVVEDRELKEHWSALAVEACLTARHAARLADQPDSGQSYLCGLLHNAPAWLDSCGAPTGVDDLPAWLTDWLDQIGQDRPRELAPRSVVQARQRIAGAEQCEAQHVPENPPLEDLLSEVPSIRERWFDTSNTAGRLLPRCIRRLGRLRQLESEFTAELEREKLEALKELAYGASHEINNPLANISTRAQTLMREETDPERRRKLAVINAQAFRAHEMISDMMLFARPPMLERRQVDLTAMVDRVISELRDDAESQGTRLVHVTADTPVVVSADANHLAVALKALCTNSLEAVGRDGKIEVLVQPATTIPPSIPPDAWVEILVRDDGPGISPQVRRHLFDPYFSGREAGRGLGLGLSKCWSIVKQHGGRIEVSSEPGRGATFTIMLPVETCPNTPTAS
jgi:signal transduction histidine kinase